MVPLACQPGEIGFCDFTKVERVVITLRGAPFPHLLAACGDVPKSCARCDCTCPVVHAARRSGPGALARGLGLGGAPAHIVGIKGESYRLKVAAARVSSDAPGPPVSLMQSAPQPD